MSAPQVFSLVLLWPLASSGFALWNVPGNIECKRGLTCWATLCGGYHMRHALPHACTCFFSFSCSIVCELECRQLKAHGALQATAVSPFKPISRSLSPNHHMNRATSPTRQVSPYRAASVKFQQQQTSAARDVMPSLQQKLQADFERYRRVGQENLLSTGRHSLSSTQRQKPPVYRSLQGSSQGGQEQGSAGVNGKHPPSMQYPAQNDDRGSGDRRSRLVHQRTADVVPRLDSLGYGAPVKQMLPNARSTLGRRGQAGRASAPPWTAGGQSSRRLSPSRFAEREQEPLLAPGLAKSQRIGAVH